MGLKTCDVNQDKQLCQQAKALYLRSFPREERIPWWLLRLNSRRKGIDLTAWMDEDIFCGFTASVTVEGMHFVLFLAIEPALHSQGYGTAILTALRLEHACVCLNVELLDPTADNYAQRQRRFAFYDRNGFADTCYHVWEIGGKFRVLSTQAELDTHRYKKVFKKLTFGLWDVKLLRAE
ncbi:MAG: GNAT family N-acetyltransferase [Oscillospiraceae bacterium]|nr:GNAT family N-acetyltransferase [Oscillospiraceae bacterium]